MCRIMPQKKQKIKMVRNLCSISPKSDGGRLTIEGGMTAKIERKLPLTCTHAMFSLRCTTRSSTAVSADGFPSRMARKMDIQRPISLRLWPVSHRKTEFPARQYPNGYKCLVCVKRCPIEAVSQSGIDRKLCWQRLNDNLHRTEELAGLENTTHVCGKCQVLVPCSLKAPKKEPID